MSKKILFINQEITPYVPETEMSLMGNKLPQHVQESGCEIRTFMPKWGNINERRGQLHEVIRSMEHAMTQAFGADVCNWECLMNNAVKAGQSTHVHWHLYPRYANGTHFAGEEFPDPKWPRHLESGEHRVSEELFGKIALAVQENLP